MTGCCCLPMLREINFQFSLAHRALPVDESSSLLLPNFFDITTWNINQVGPKKTVILIQKSFSYFMIFHTGLFCLFPSRWKRQKMWVLLWSGWRPVKQHAWSDIFRAHYSANIGIETWTFCGGFPLWCAEKRQNNPRCSILTRWVDGLACSEV